MLPLGLKEAREIFAAEKETIRNTSFATQHLIGVAWIRLLDIEFCADALPCLDPMRIRQVKRGIRERGFCVTDPPISLLSVDIKSSTMLRQRIGQQELLSAPVLDLESGSVSSP